MNGCKNLANSIDCAKLFIMQNIECRLAPFQYDFINSENRVVSIIAAKGAGKAQPLSEPVLTPRGFVPMGSLIVGDMVIGSDGNPHAVTGIYPQGMQDTYLVNFSDGTQTHSTIDHLWAVQTGSHKHRGHGFKVKTLGEILADLKTKQGYNKWYMPLVEPINFSPKNLPIPPYSLGIILGDGGITKPQVVISTADKHILERVSHECSIRYKHRSKYDYVLTNNERDKNGYGSNHLVSALRTMGLIGKKSHEKFIPLAYLRGSAEQRIDLMRGLMDSDGYCDARGVGYFTTTSRIMADQFVELCRSLGLTTRATHKKSERYLDSYNVRVNAPFNPFWINRKASKFNINATQGRTKAITGAVYVGKQECQCISVDAPDSLYVTRDYILTHNTWIGARFIAQQVCEQPGQQGLVMFNTLQQARDIFFQDVEPLLKELGWPYAFNEQKMVLRLLGSIVHFRSAEPDAIQRIESVAYSWGWADELSFYNPEAVRTFVSRIRKGLALIRITSMPDEPDAFMYSFIEGLDGIMHEVGLKDNPDRVFADRYEKFLRATYEGAQLERFLHGKRVSLSGLGIFAAEQEHRIKTDHDPDDELLLVWDFNNEYRAVGAWQQIGFSEDGYPVVAVVKSWRLRNATVYEDSVEMAEWILSNHNSLVLLHGDASGTQRTAATTYDMWTTIKNTFDKKQINYRYIVPRSNPNVKDTIECLNWAFRKKLFLFNESERNVFMSVQAVRSDRYGEIDKSIDYNNTKSSIRTHEADIARYAGWHYFAPLYPGGAGELWVV